MAAPSPNPGVVVTGLVGVRRHDPPTTPEDLRGSSLPYGRTMLTWKDSHDDVTSMLRFAVLRDRQYLGRVVTTTFVDRRLTGSHSYTVQANDAAGNASAAAPTVVVNTSQ